MGQSGKLRYTIINHYLPISNYYANHSHSVADTLLIRIPFIETITYLTGMVQLYIIDGIIIPHEK